MKLRVLLAACVLGSTLPAVLPATSACAATPSGPHVGLVIRFSAGAPRDFCVPFEKGMTSYDLLKKSAFPLVVRDFGPGGIAVCAIAKQGQTDPNSCLPPCPKSGCVFWGFYLLDAHGAWTFSAQGASAHVVTAGEVDGWSFGTQTPKGGAPPGQPTTLAAVCEAAAAAAAVPAPGSSATPLHHGRLLPVAGLLALLLALGALAFAFTRARRRTPA